MKKTLVSLALAALLAAPTSALAVEGLAYDDSLVITSGYSMNYIYENARIENTSDQPICVTSTRFEAYDESGDVVASDEYSSLYSQYLQPGEYTYLCFWNMIEPSDAEAIVDHALIVDGENDGTYVSLHLSATAELQQVDNGYYTTTYVVTTVTNNTDTPLWGVQALAGVYASDGTLVYVGANTIGSDVAILPGNSVMFKAIVDSDIVEMLDEQGLSIASIDVIAFAEVDAVDAAAVTYSDGASAYVAAATVAEPAAEEPEGEEPAGDGQAEGDGPLDEGTSVLGKLLGNR